MRSPSAQGLIETNAFDGYRKVIDVSADSAYSLGGMPIAVARRAALSADIVINGLAILCRASECSGRPNDYDLEAAFADAIIGGPASFVVRADRDDRFAQAVRRKLVLEIAGAPGARPRTPASPGVTTNPALGFWFGQATGVRSSSQRPHGMASSRQPKKRGRNRNQVPNFNYPFTETGARSMR